MKTLNHIFTTYENLELWLEGIRQQNASAVLVQFFSEFHTYAVMQDMANFLTRLMPEAEVVGVTTDSKIYEQASEERFIVINCSIFEHAALSVRAWVGEDMESDSFDRDFISEDIEAVILYTNDNQIIKSGLIQTLQEKLPDHCTLSGGLSSNATDQGEALISYKDQVFTKGAVVITISGKKFYAAGMHECKWEIVSSPMSVTKKSQNRLYEIDGIPVVALYEKYFGTGIAEKLPKIGTLLPLLVKRYDVNTVMFPVKRYEDGSLLFEKEFHSNEAIYFAIATTMSKEKHINIYKSLTSGNRVDALFLFSDIQELQNSEEELNRSHFTVQIFFSGGTFIMEKNHIYMLDNCSSILALSESGPLNVVKKYDPKVDENAIELLPALSHIIHVMTGEWKKRFDDDALQLVEKDKLINQNNKLMQMGEMVSMIAHQWRQPLNSLSATAINISLLSMMGELTQEEIEENTHFIQEQCQSMSDTIDTFMNFVKPAKQAKPFKLTDTISAIMKIIGTQLINHTIELELLTDDAELSIVGHEDLLEQVLLNLLTNARDAFEDKEIPSKRITIAIDTLNGTPRITVEDNAGGIPEEIRTKVFNPYFTTKPPGKGTGLGMYMSLDIMRKSFAGDLLYTPTENGSHFELLFHTALPQKKVLPAS